MDRTTAIHAFRTAGLGATLVFGGACLGFSAHAHPHVFIDGGVDFRFDDSAKLSSLEVTWLYDEFETLYILAANQLALNDAGGLDEPDRLTLEQAFSAWPDDFDGSAHLTHNGQTVVLKWPTDPQVELVNGRIQATFTRDLETPMDMRGREAEVAFYESTYFFAFKVTNTPRLEGAGGCAADVIPFSPDPNDASLLLKLAQLSREETPDTENVGLLFADRIALRCE